MDDLLELDLLDPWGQTERFLVFDDVSRKYVPDVLGENVRNEEVDVLGGVCMLA